MSSNALVVFSWADFARFASELTLKGDAIVLHESTDAPPENIAADGNVVAIPFTALAREVGSSNGKNILALGVLAAIVACRPKRSARPCGGALRKSRPL